MKIGIVAGEASGDLLGEGLIRGLRELQPTVEIEGIGGSAMHAAGCRNLFNSEQLAVMGFVEPLRHLPELLKIRTSIRDHFLKNRPDVFVGIDSPDFNLGLELELRKAGIPVVHYVSPSVWAWRQYRIHKIKKAVDKILTLFPFEKQFYDQHKVPATFVGHPLADKIPLEVDQAAARAALNLPAQGVCVALLPGSRQGEISHMGPTFIKTAQLLKATSRVPLQFLCPVANEKREQELKKILAKIAPELSMQFFKQQSQYVLAAADVALVASGTATLETMLYKCPMVIVYQTGFFTYHLAKWLVDVPFIGLPNLLANRSLVPEYIQDEAKPEVLCDAVLDWLLHPEKQKALKAQFTYMHRDLQRNANQEAVRAVLSVIK